MSHPPSRLNAVDTAWLRMDSPRNLMMIVGVWMFEPALDPRALRRRLKQRLLCHPRFVQKVRRDPLGATWVDDEDFDLSRHLVLERPRREPGWTAEQALQARVGELAATPFDPERPLWQFHLLRHEAGSALIFRLHHCIADGVALFALLASLADGATVLAPPEREAASRRDADERAPGAERRSLAPAPVPAAAGADPLHLWRQGARAVRDGVSLLAQGDDSRTRLKGRLSGRKRVGWAEPLPLARVKAAGRALGGSVNDLMLACVAGALGEWLREQGDDPARQSIRVMVPVNLRPIGEAWRLGNVFGVVPVLLPLGLDDIRQRVAEMHRRMGEMKDGFKPRLAYDLLALSGRSLPLGQDLVMRVAMDRTTAVMTNVPGPASPLRLCDRELRRFIVWVPSSADVGVGASIVSYAGRVQFGLVTDEARCADPQRVAQLFAREFDLAASLAQGRAGPS